MNKKKNKIEQEAGVITVAIVFLLISLVTMLAITVDLGNTYLQHIKLRRALDLAAVSVTNDFPLSTSASGKQNLQDKVEYIIFSNGIDLDKVDLDLEWTAISGTQAYALKMTLSTHTYQLFGKFLGKEYSNISVGNFIYASTNALGGREIKIIDA